MIITLEVSGDLEGKLQESIARHDAESVRRVLHAAVEPAVAALLQPPAQTDPESFHEDLQRLVNQVAGYLGPDHQPLSDYAISREGIYEDHA